MSDIHPKIALARAQQQFSRLMGLSEKQHQALKNDPLPYLQAAGTELSSQRKRIMRAIDTLTGADRITEPHDLSKPCSIESVLQERITSALAILRCKT